MPLAFCYNFDDNIVRIACARERVCVVFLSRTESVRFYRSFLMLFVRCSRLPFAINCPCQLILKQQPRFANFCHIINILAYDILGEPVRKERALLDVWPVGAWRHAENRMLFSFMQHFSKYFTMALREWLRTL